MSVSPNSLRTPRFHVLVLCLCVVMLSSCCGFARSRKAARKFTYTPLPRKTIEELYHEALTANKPEQNLGMDHPLKGHDSVVVPPHPGIPAGSSIQPVPQAELPVLPVAPPPPPLSNSANASPVSFSTDSPSATGILQAGGEEKPVSDIFTESDVREAVQSLATQAGVPIVLDDTVRGSVSCTIENESFEQALQRVLLPLGLVYRKKDNLYLIGSTDPASNLFPHIAESMEYKPQHLSTQELLSLLPTRHTQFVRIVDKRNVVQIEAPRDTAKQIYQQLEKADQPIPQIMIEAIVCVVSPDSGLQFGMDANHGLQVNGLDRLNLGFSGLSFSGAVSPYGVNNAFDDFAVTSAFLKLLAREGHVMIRAAPRVMAKDGEKAEISIARDTFFSLQNGNNQIFFSQSIQKVEAGISLNLTPTIRGDNVQIVIEKAEVSEDIRTTDSNQNVTNNPFPIINRRRVTTTVQVKDQQTVVIGGLMGKQTVDRETGIPGLCRMPWVGRAFTRIEQQEQEVEVAIFISPKIVVPTAHSALPGPHGEVPLVVPQGAPVPETAPAPNPVVSELHVLPNS